MLQKANETFKRSNGFYLRPEEIYKISYYNDIVDKTSRAKLEGINPNDFINVALPGKEMVCNVFMDFRNNVLK